MLSEIEKFNIRQKLKRQNARIFTDEAITNIMDRMDDLHAGRVGLQDFFIAELKFTFEDLLYQLKLTKFINNDP